MNSITGPSLGLFRAASLRSGGIALDSACRTIRPMHAQFLRDRTNRARAMHMFPPDLFE
jgi:hypothetical protein